MPPSVFRLPISLQLEHVHVEASPKQQIAELDGLLLRNRRLAGRDDGHRRWYLQIRGPDQGIRVLRRKGLLVLGIGRCAVACLMFGFWSSYFGCS
jgi:hypothetical protein